MEEKACIQKVATKKPQNFCGGLDNRKLCATITDSTPAGRAARQLTSAGISFKGEA